MTQTPRGFDSQDPQDPRNAPPPAYPDSEYAGETAPPATDGAGYRPGPPAGSTDLVSGPPATASPAPAPVGTTPPAAEPETPETPRVTRAGMVWVAVASALVVLSLLIAFILQNQEYVQVKFFGLAGSVPLGVALFIAAVGGGVLVAVAGAARIIQLRLAAHRRRGKGRAGQVPRRR